MSDEQVNDQGQEQSQDDHADDQSKNNQATTDDESSESNDQNENQEQTVEIDGEEVPISELKKGYMRGKDYTHKTQELAKERRGKAQSSSDDAVDTVDMNDPEAVKALKVLKGMGFVTQKDIDNKLSQIELSQKQQRKLDGIVESNPSLKPFKKAIEILGKNTGEAWEDIIHNYGFAQKATLQRAKASVEIKGTPKSKTQNSEKSVGKMTDEEYEVWRKANLGKSSNFTRLSK